MTPMEITEDAVWGYVFARCQELKVGHQALKGAGRTREIARARAIIADELRRAPWELSLSAIGSALGGKDHSSVWWMLRGGRHK